MTSRTRTRIKLIRAKMRVVVRAPADRVFNYMTDIQTLAEWQTGVVGASGTGRTMYTGMTVDLVTAVKLPGRTRHESVTVTECRPESSLAFSSSYGPYQFQIRYTLEPAVDSCTVRCDLDSRATEWAARFLLPFVSRTKAKRLASSLRSLRERLES